MADTTKKMKVAYKVKGESGVEVAYAVKRPNPKLVTDGQKVFNRAFRDALDSHAIVRAKVESVAREQKLWDDSRQAEADRISTEIIEAEKTIGRGYKLSPDGKTKETLRLAEARSLALSLQKLRAQARELWRERNALDGQTAEAQADNARFEFYAASCIVYDEGERAGTPVFSGVDDYAEHAGERHAYEGAGHLAAMILGGADPDWEKKLPENKFLAKYGFVDDKARLVDKKTGKLIDAEGRTIDENGRYVDAEGRFVNRAGDRVDEAGNYVFDDAVEFLDDAAEEPVAIHEAHPAPAEAEEPPAAP